MLTDNIIVQAGTETTWGCDAAPTVKIMGITGLEITETGESEQVKWMQGRLAPGNLSIRKTEEAAAQLEGLVIYEDAPYWLDMAFGRCDSDALSAQWVSDTDTYLRLYDAPVVTFDTDLEAARVMTLVRGDLAVSSNSHNIQGATLQTMTLEGGTGEGLTWSLGFMGKNRQADTLSPATDVPDRDVTVAMGGHCSLYIDPSTATVGTTAIANTAFSFSLEVDTHRTALRHLGALKPSNYRDAQWEGTLTLEMASSSDVVDNYLPGLLTTNTLFEKVVRIIAETGTGATRRELRFDFNGVLIEQPVFLTNMEGIETVELVFQGQYHATLGNWLKFRSRNATAAMA
jgi:hypothetical protein